MRVRNPYHLIVAGWTKHSSKRIDARGKTYFCATSAIREVTNGIRPYSRQDKAILAMRSKLLEVITSRSRPSIVDWNDSPRRTKKEVVAAFRKAFGTAKTITIP